MNTHPIGVLDSGFGGLTIWREVATLLPEESILYLADSARCPYGNRSQEEITGFARQMVHFLVEKRVKLIVVACNTITVHALTTLRQEYPNVPIVGTVPVIKTAASLTAGPIGILSTNATAKSAYQEQLIRMFAPGRVVVNQGSDMLVPLVEQGIVEGPQVQAVLQKVLEPFRAQNVQAIALGCSHFPFLRDAMERIVDSDVAILDSGAAIARQVKRVLAVRNALANENKRYRFYTTGDKGHFEAVLRKLMPEVGEGVHVEEVTL